MLRSPFSSAGSWGRVRSVRSLVAARTNSIATAAQVQSRDWETAKPFDSIPGPTPLPVIGNTWRFLPILGDYWNLDFRNLTTIFNSKYGKISRFGGIPGRKDLIMLFDPVDAEKVFRNEGVWPIRTGVHSIKYYRKITRKDFFKDAGGIGVTQGEEWGKFRTTVNQPMMQPRVARNYVTPIGDVADDFIKRMYMIRDVNIEMPHDFINELYKWTLESIFMIALDTRLGLLKPTLAPNSEPQKMIDSVKLVFDTIFTMEFKLPMWKLMNTPTWKSFVLGSDYLLETGMKYVNLALERLKSLPADSDRELSILEHILARDPNPRVACVMAIDMMLGGIDTTSNAVAFLLYHLAVNPDKQRILQDEIDRVIPSSSQVDITGEQLGDLKYLKACIKESMRLTPIVQVNTRTTIKDMVIQGYQIPEGTDVALGHGTMNLDQANYPKPDQFIPERWLKNQAKDAHKTHPFVTLPFGFGVRMCVGRRFAEIKIEILVAKILQRFNLEWHYGSMVIESKFLNTCKSPLKFRMIDRI